MPPGEVFRNIGIAASVRHGSGGNAFDQRMRLTSTNIEANPHELLRHAVHFATGADVLDQAARDELDRFMRRFQSASAHAAHQEIRVDLIGHASAIGGEIQNQSLSERRIQSVVTYLRSKGFPNIDTRIHPDPRGESEADQGTPDRPGDRRVDILVDGGERQIAALHEWGHAFGMGDEYPGTGRPVGANAAHNALAQAMTDASGNALPGAAVERTGAIMASGNDIRPRYYATFHHALQTVTGKSPWSLGLHKRKWEVGMECGEPSPPGDWNPPVDTGDTRTV
jgi:outer membrane protein OmpA-like peptidoglycan-associated protein